MPERVALKIKCDRAMPLRRCIGRYDTLTPSMMWRNGDLKIGPEDVIYILCHISRCYLMMGFRFIPSVMFDWTFLRRRGDHHSCLQEKQKKIKFWPQASCILGSIDGCLIGSVSSIVDSAVGIHLHNPTLEYRVYPYSITPPLSTGCTTAPP